MAPFLERRERGRGLARTACALRARGGAGEGVLTAGGVGHARFAVRAGGVGRAGAGVLRRDCLRMERSRGEGASGVYYNS